jgi:hypothetical protein
MQAHGLGLFWASVSGKNPARIAEAIGRLADKRLPCGRRSVKMTTIAAKLLPDPAFNVIAEDPQTLDVRVLDDQARQIHVRQSRSRQIHVVED